MRIRAILTIASLLALCGTTGCSICQGPFDQHYGAYGGSLERTNPTEGRVNSAFESAHAPEENSPPADAPEPTAFLPRYVE